MVLAVPLIVRRSATKAATCLSNPVVMNNADSGAGSLRQAILDACDGSTITFANTVISPITLVSELPIDKNLTIHGPGAAMLTISGNNAVRVFNIGSVNNSVIVTMSGLTIANGQSNRGVTLNPIACSGHEIKGWSRSSERPRPSMSSANGLQRTVFSKGSSANG